MLRSLKFFVARILGMTVDCGRVQGKMHRVDTSVLIMRSSSRNWRQPARQLLEWALYGSPLATIAVTRPASPPGRDLRLTVRRLD